MSAFIGALLLANMINTFLNGMFVVQLATFCGSILLAEPVFIRVIVFGFSIFDVSQTAVMAYVALYASFGSHKSRLFVWLYSTIRLWSVPIYVAAYGFYAFQVQRLTDRWMIPVLVICLLVVQTGGAMLWAIGTMKAGTLVDLARGNAMTMTGTVLCTTGAFICSLCILVSVIVTFRNSPVRVLLARRGVLRHLQIVSMRVHIPLVVMSATDLVAYILFPESHISTVIAIIIGKAWSNTLLHGLNSRQALRHAPVTATTLNNGIEFVPQWGQTSSSMNDSFTVELTEMGILGPDRSGDESGVPSLEQDISSVWLSKDMKNLGGGDPDRLASPVRFGEQLNPRRGGNATSGVPPPRHDKAIPRSICLVTVFRLWCLDRSNQILRG